MRHKTSGALLGILIFLLLLSKAASAQESSIGNDSGKALPRLACIKYSTISARSGPSRQHPALWTYTKRGYPIQIIAEFEHWRQIIDVSGDKSWIHKSSLSKGKYTLIKANGGTKMYRVPPRYDKKSKTNPRNFAYIMDNVKCKIIRCRQDWCKIECREAKGWVERKNCWGV